MNKPFLKPHKATAIPDEVWKAYKIPPPIREFKFHPMRKWRFDFAWPSYWVAVEIDGGIWTNGGHVRGKGFNNDREKSNAAVELGWKVLYYTPQNIDFEQIKRILENTFHKI